MGLTADLREARELATLIEDYVPAADRDRWLHAPLDAFSGVSPIQMIQAGRARELIVEFRRLPEGQPL